MRERDAAAPRVARKRTRRKWFAVAEADRALPLVSRIVTDIVEQHRNFQTLRAEQAAARLQRRSAAEELSARCSEAVNRLHELEAELTMIGCQLKDLSTGLLDFPGRRLGRDILLCWKLGEPRIGYWHDLQAGYAGRRPIDEACE